MAPQEVPTEKISLSSTKKEMLDAYNRLAKQLKEKREAESKPEQRIEEKENQEALALADALSMEGIAGEIGALKSEVGKMLSQLSDRLEEEVGKYLQVKKAGGVREKQLREIYEIEKSASTLMALLETQKQKRELFDAEIGRQREELQGEIESKRAEWERERAAHADEIKERDAAEKKRREREAEEYRYQSERQQQLAREQFDYEKAKLERELQLKKEETERQLALREKALSERENEMNVLRAKVAAFPKELEAAVDRAIKEATDRLTREAKSREQLSQKEFEGERNVLKSRIEALQQAVKEQTERIAKLTSQMEKSYGQVQEIAMKAIEGPSGLKAFAPSAPAHADVPRRPGPAEG